MCEPKHGIIFRSADDLDCGKDPYVETFEQADIKCQVIPVLNFEFTNMNELKSKLSKSEQYSGIIFSSPRCVKAVSMAVDDISKWKNHRIFVIGEKTAKIVETEFGLQTEGSFSGKATVLADYILKQNITKPILLPCGNLCRDVLSKTLTDGGFKLDQIVVYKTLADPNIESNIKKAFDKSTVRYILYFSPSAVDITFPIFTKHGINLNKIKWAAIGPTTENELLKHSVQVSIVAESPTPEHFAVALQRFLREILY